MPTRAERRRNVDGHRVMSDRGLAELRRRMPSDRQRGISPVLEAYVNRRVGSGYYQETQRERTSIQNSVMADGDRVRSMNGRNARPLSGGGGRSFRRSR